MASPSDLRISVESLEEADGPSANGECCREEEEPFDGIFLIGCCFGGRSHDGIGDEAGVDEDGDIFFISESREYP